MNQSWNYSEFLILKYRWITIRAMRGNALGWLFLTKSDHLEYRGENKSFSDDLGFCLRELCENRVDRALKVIKQLSRINSY